MKIITLLALVPAFGALAACTSQSCPPLESPAPIDRELEGKALSTKEVPHLRELLFQFATRVAAEKRAKLFEQLKVKELERVGNGTLYLVEAESIGAMGMILSDFKDETLRKKWGLKYVEANLQYKTFESSKSAAPKAPTK